MRVLRACSIAVAIICSVVISTAGQTSPEESTEFRSIVGRFGIQLPKVYSSYNGAVPLDLSNQKFLVSIYRWNIPIGQFSVSYAGSEADLESRSGDFLTKFRERILQQSGKLVRERETDLDGHPGFELISESADLLTISQVFLVKNRFYFLSMSLNSSQRTDARAALAAFNSFRLLPSDVLEAELEKVVNNFAPEPLRQEPFIARPTTDCHDEGLKGKVRTVVMEREDYLTGNVSPGNKPAGVVVVEIGESRVVKSSYLDSEVQFNERCDRVRYVEYNAGLPSTAIVYGYANGERVATLAFKPFDIILITEKSKEDLLPTQTKPRIESLKFKYKYSNDGQLLERRTLFANGVEFEKLVRNPTKNKIEQTGGDMMGVLLKGPTATYLLDDNGNPVEKTFVVETTEPYTQIVSGQTIKSQRVNTSTIRETYTYEFDSHGNWIKQVASRMEKKDGKSVSTPIRATYRRITYF